MVKQGRQTESERLNKLRAINEKEHGKTLKIMTKIIVEIREKTHREVVLSFNLRLKRF